MIIFILIHTDLDPMQYLGYCIGCNYYQWLRLIVTKSNFQSQLLIKNKLTKKLTKVKSKM